MTSPETIFDTVVARSEEIILGTVVAVLFASLLFPASVRPMLRARIGNWMEDAAQWCRQILNVAARMRHATGWPPTWCSSRH